MSREGPPNSNGALRATHMQTEIRFTNGYWKLFDSRSYRDLGKFDSLKEAKQAKARRAKN